MRAIDKIIDTMPSLPAKIPQVTTTDEPRNAPPVEMLSISQLHFDPDNPRLPSTIDKTNERDVLEWMIDNATVTELMGSIAEKGYFPGEPLMAAEDGKGTGRYFVIEGNRRLAAVKLLLQPDLAPIRARSVLQASENAQFRPDELPVMVFPSRESILDNLGFRHITGIKPWPPLAKARFLAQLLETLPPDMPHAQKMRALAKSIGSRTDAVEKWLIGYEIYQKVEQERFFGIRGLNEESMEFSLLTTALGLSNISDFVGLADHRSMDTSRVNMDHLQKLVRWVFERNPENRTRVGESRQLVSLNKILDPQRPLALEAFEAGRPLSEAILLTDEPTENFRSAIADALSRLGDAQDNLKNELDLRQADVENLDVARRLCVTIRDAVKAQLRGDEDDEA